MTNAVTLNADDNAYADEIYNKLKINLGLTDYEVGLLKSINGELKKPLPTTPAGVESRINVLDMYRVKLLNFIYAVNDKASKFEYEYKKVYDPKFVQLTRAGRPNQQAVDSEIHNDISMQDNRLVLHNFENFKGLLFGYLKTIDTAKDTCMQKWKQGGYM